MAHSREYREITTGETVNPWNHYAKTVLNTLQSVDVQARDNSLSLDIIYPHSRFWRWEGNPKIGSMGLRKAVSAFIRGRQSDTLVRECRQCGTTLDEETTVCPSCGSTEIAQYQFS